MTRQDKGHGAPREHDRDWALRQEKVEGTPRQVEGNHTLRIMRTLLPQVG